MKEKLFNDKKIQTTKKYSLKKSLLLTVSLIFFFSLYFYLHINIHKSKTISLPSKNLKSLSESNSSPNKVKIIPYISPNRVEGILDNLFYPYHSDIIRTIDEFEFLRDNLGKVELRMILNSNIHGDFAKDFHERANYKHLLILIETIEGNRFGGYTSDNFVPMTVGLISTSIDIQKYDDVAFLFNLDTKKIYDINEDKVEAALNCDEYYTLSFGEKDLIIWDYFLTKGGVSNFPDYYGKGAQPLELTGGEQNFQINSIEVYQVLFYAEFGDDQNKMGQYKTFVS
jgi:hypothetical protein